MDFSNFLTPHGLAVLVLLGAYPALTSMPFVVAGMAIGRLDLRNPDVAARLLAVGAALAVLGYGASWLALHPLGGLHHVLASVPAHDRAAATADPFGGFDGFVPTTSIAWLLSSAPYSGTPFWIAGAGGIAIFVLGACLLLTRPGTVQHPAMAQLANLGSMVLSAYALHIVASAILPDTDTAAGDWVELVGVSSAVLLLAEMWRRLVSQRGPLETVLHVWSTRAADAVLGNEGDTRPEPAPPTSTMTRDAQETVTR